MGLKGCLHHLSGYPSHYETLYLKKWFLSLIFLAFINNYDINHGSTNLITGAHNSSQMCSLGSYAFGGYQALEQEYHSNRWIDMDEYLVHVLLFTQWSWMLSELAHFQLMS